MRRLLVVGDLDRIGELAGSSRSVLGVLLAQTYDPDPQVAWRAIEATGVAAGRLAEADPEAVREHLRRLFWLLTEESGGIGWRAPEAMAVIVERCPGRFDDYAPIVVHLLTEMAEEDLEHFRPGILWAIGRLGGLAGEVVDDVLPEVLAALDHTDPVVRGTAAWCLGRVGRTDALAVRSGLRDDPGTLRLYEEGELRSTTVGRIVSAALGPRAVEGGGSRGSP